MIIAGLLAGLLTIFVAGFGTTTLALRGCAPRNLIEICALSWILGTGVVSLLLWGCGTLLSGIALQITVTALALGLGVCGYAVIRRRRATVFLPVPRNQVEWLIAAVIAVQFAIMMYASGTHGLGWDGLLNWEVKARYAFLNNGVIPAAYYADSTRYFTHQTYPLWIPFTELWLYLWMGQAHQFWIKLIFPLFYIAGAILLATVATRLTGRRWIGLVAATLLFFVPCLTNTPGGAQVGYVDVPISVAYLAAIGYLLLASEKSEAAAWRIYALCLPLLPWAKREGTILWLIAVLCGVFVIWRTRRSWFALSGLLPGVAMIITWKIFCAAMGGQTSPENLPMTFRTLIENLPRTTTIVPALFAEMTETTRWSLFWPIVALAFLSLFIRFRDRRLIILAVAVWLPVFVYSAVFIFSGWSDLTGHIQASLPRLLLQVMPLCWLAISLAMRPPPMRNSVESGAEAQEIPSDHFASAAATRELASAR